MSDIKVANTSLVVYNQQLRDARLDPDFRDTFPLPFRVIVGFTSDRLGRVRFVDSLPTTRCTALATGTVRSSTWLAFHHSLY